MMQPGSCVLAFLSPLDPACRSSVSCGNKADFQSSYPESDLVDSNTLVYHLLCEVWSCELLGFAILERLALGSIGVDATDIAEDLMKKL